MTEKKTAVIGAAALDINISGSTPVSLNPEGRMLSVSVALARRGVPVTFISEAARDRVGDLIVSRLEREGVATGSIDRYAGGHTPLNLRFLPDGEHDATDSVRYRAYPQDAFDAVWPRIDRDDVVVIGDYFAVAPRNVKFVREFVASCRQRRALVVYAPGFDIHAGKQLTSVKPALLDALEWADFVVATLDEMKAFFKASTLDEAYRNSISFYCPNFLGLEAGDKGASMRFFGPHYAADEPLPDESAVTTARGNAAVIASFVNALLSVGVTRQDVAEGLSDDMRLAILGAMDAPDLPL